MTSSGAAVGRVPQPISWVGVVVPARNEEEL
ncbi:MAG: hypothetical protein JWN96_4056, partial [Mycobacterium sp.]|nr:hypothetical protein [Mycobacterium sp.]